MLQLNHHHHPQQQEQQLRPQLLEQQLHLPQELQLQQLQKQLLKLQQLHPSQKLQQPHPPPLQHLKVRQTKYAHLVITGYVAVTTVTITDQVGYVKSANYPSQYNTMETTSSMISCKGNAKSLVVMILNITLANGDHLLLNGVQTSGPINYPVPKFYTPGSLNVTFVSDASQVANGFNLAFACHGEPVMVAMTLSPLTMIHR